MLFPHFAAIDFNNRLGDHPKSWFSTCSTSTTSSARHVYFQFKFAQGHSRTYPPSFPRFWFGKIDQSQALGSIASCCKKWNSDLPCGTRCRNLCYVMQLMFVIIFAEGIASPFISKRPESLPVDFQLNEIHFFEKITIHKVSSSAPFTGLKF